LGFVTPYAVRLRISAINDSGKTVGRLFAFSTIGSIVGTFGAGFFLIPFVGSLRTMYLIASGLIALSILLAPFALTRFNLGILILFVLSVTANELNTYYLRQTNGLYDIDTEYSHIQVFRTTEPKSGKPIEALAIDPYFVQSAVFLDSDEPVLEYSRFYHLMRHFKPDFQRTLIIGGAGFTFPREYLRTYTDKSIDVVEIDPQMVHIARKFFRLKDDPRMNVIHQDGRVFLNRAQTGAYDVVLMDAFGSLFTAPYQLTTVEAVQNISRVLGEDGVVISNLGSAITGRGSQFFQAEFKSYSQVFPQVFLFKVNLKYSEERLQNLIIVGFKSKRPLPMSSDDAFIADLLSHRYTGEFPLEWDVLTDDLAPVEYYNSVAQNLYLRQR
jgi:spermidine synthase